MKNLPLHIALVLCTLIIYGVTLLALQRLGADQGMVFITDFSHPWRAQFNTDFSLHIIVFAAWVLWRAQNVFIGILCALGCLLGGLFTFPYLFVNLLLCRGDIKLLLLGRHAATQP